MPSNAHTIVPVPKPASEPRKPRKALPRATKPIPRYARVKKRSRKGSRFPHLRDQSYTGWIATLRCLIGTRCEGGSDCAHVRTRGAGGKDRGNCVPLCRRHHDEQHSIGIKSFQRKYGVDLAAIALELEQRYHEETSWM